MTRKNLFLIVIVFIVGVSVWIFFVNKSLKSSQEVILEELQQRPQPRRVPSVVTEDSKRVHQVLKGQLESEIGQLQRKIDVEKARLQAQKMALESIKNQQLQINTAPNYASQISEYTSEVQDFVEELQNYELLEEEINQKAADYLREQSSASQVLRDQIEESIRRQDMLIRQTQEQISYWQANNSYLNEREARLQDLTLLLENQNQQMQQLRDQRLQLSSEILANTEALNQEKNQALSEVQENRRNVQQEISDVRVEINRLLALQYRTRSNRNSLLSQVLQMQKEFDRQNEYVKELETSRLEKDQQMKLLE